MSAERRGSDGPSRPSEENGAPEEAPVELEGPPSEAAGDGDGDGGAKRSDARPADEATPQRISRSKRAPLAMAIAAGISLLIWLLLWSIGKFFSVTLVAAAITMLGMVWYTYMRRRSTAEGIVFYSHNQILYYWPIWLGGFVISDFTGLFGTKSTVPAANGGEEIIMLCSPSMGLFFLIVIATVVFFTSVNIRGVWAVVLGVSVVATGLLFSVFNWWPGVLNYLGGLTLYVNRDFFSAMGVVIFVPWFIVVFLFDMRRYFHFMPTQIKMVNEIGEGEKNFDSMGAVMEKQRDNFVQHMALGFGSGDLIITTSGGQRDIIIFPNVLRIDRVLDEIQLIRERRGRE